MITNDDYIQFIYNFDPNGKERFGQSFVNHFNLEDPALFYESNDETAGELIKEYLEE